MEAAEILREFGVLGRFPTDAVRAAREQRAVMLPVFLDAIERCIDGTATPETKEAACLIFHVLGEWREKSAYRPLVSLMRLPPDTLRETVGGGAITETARKVIASVFDGDPGPLYELIRDIDADEFARAAGCEALAVVTLRGALARDEAARFLRACGTELRPQEECYVWSGWQEAIAVLGLVELIPLVKEAFDREFISSGWLDFSDFEEDIRDAVKGKPSRGLGDYRELFGDAIEELSSWYCYSEKYSRDLEKRRLRSDAAPPPSAWTPLIPSVNPYRDVGRNDPCPCGSGKKFKKCCLGKVEAQEREKAAAARFRAEADLDSPFSDGDYDLEDEILEDVLDRPLAAYDAETGPDPERWLALDEDERLRLVKAYHRRVDDAFERPDLHATAHLIVENQVAMGDELPVRRKLAALMDEGLDRHEAIHAIGAVLMMHVHHLMSGAATSPGPQVNDAYFAALETLTAQSWRRDFG